MPRSAKIQMNSGTRTRNAKTASGSGLFTGSIRVYQSSSAASIRRYSSAVGSKELEEALWVEEGDEDVEEDVDAEAFSLELSEELEEER